MPVSQLVLMGIELLFGNVGDFLTNQWTEGLLLPAMFLMASSIVSRLSFNKFLLPCFIGA